MSHTKDDQGYIKIIADSPEEAVAKAKAALGRPEQDIEIRPAREQKSLFIPFRKARTYLARIKPIDNKKLLENILNDVLGPLPSRNQNEDLPESSGKPVATDGWVSVSEGRVIVKNPENGGKYPSVIPGNNVTITLNGEIITEETVVTAEDKITVSLPDEEPPVTELDVEIDDDAMNAYLKVKRVYGKKYRLRDTEPGLHVKITAEAEEKFPPDDISRNEIMALLNRKGIRFGIRDEAVTSAIEVKGEGEWRFPVAVGQAPIPGNKGAIEYLFLRKFPDSEHRPHNPYQDTEYPAVEVGEVLAVKAASVPGREGYNIFGEKIAPPPIDDNENIIAGKGVQLIKNGTVAVAAVTGRPVLSGRKVKKLEVLPIYTVPCDVDIHVGNISFKGDVVVNGSVMEGFRITAGGNIKVMGNVVKARLQAGGHITVMQNIISSEITAGADRLTYHTVLPLLCKTSAMIQGLLQAAYAVKKHHSFRIEDLQEGEGRLVQLLLDHRFNLLPRTIQQITEILRDSPLTEPAPDLETVVQLLQKLTGINALRIHDLQEVQEILQYLEKAVGAVENLLDLYGPANISADYCQNSILRASGNIILNGRGAITSELTAGGDIRINGPTSVVRGGKLSFGGEAVIREIGSSGSVYTLVHLGKNNVLKASKAHPSVTIDSEFGKFVFQEPARNIKAYISPQQKLEVEKLKAI